MNKCDVVVVVCRLLAIWVFIDAIYFITDMFTQTGVMRLFQPHMDEGVVNTSMLYFLVPLILERIFLALGLWIFAPGIAIFLLGKFHTPEHETTPSILDWFSIAIALLGIYWLTLLIGPILMTGYNFALNYGNWISSGSTGLPNSTLSNMLGLSITHLVQLAFALFLINSSRWIAYKLAIWQRWDSVEKSS